jgi:hypothetical protein
MFIKSFDDYKHGFTKRYINIHFSKNFYLKNRDICWYSDKHMYESIVKFINFNKISAGMFIKILITVCVNV